MQFPPEVRGSQPFLTSGFQQQEQLWGARSPLPVHHGPPSIPPSMPSPALYSGWSLCPAWPPSSPPPLAAFPSAPTPWVQTVPESMPWGTYGTAVTGEPQVMRFSAGDEAPRWAVNERRFRKRHLPHLVDAGFPPRKQVITEEKIAAQMSDLSLDGMVPSTGDEVADKEKRLHVLCPDLEPSPEPLLPRPVLEDLRKRTSMAVVLWQPPLAQKLNEPNKEPKDEEGTLDIQEARKTERQEQEISMDL